MGTNKSYELTATERSIFQQINNNALMVKAKAYDLRMQLDQAQADLVNLQNQFSGKLDALQEKAGITGGGLTQDMARLVGPAAPQAPPDGVVGPQGPLGPVAVPKPEVA